MPTDGEFAPVASDARELVYTIWQIVTQGSGTYWAAREDEAAAEIERYAAERERKAREEEEEPTCYGCVRYSRKGETHVCTLCSRLARNDLYNAAIKETENGK